MAGCATEGGGGTFEFHRVDKVPASNPVLNLTSEQLAALPQPVVAALDQAVSSNSSSAEVRPASSWQQTQDVLGCHPGYLLYHSILLECAPGKIYN
jgi:hypothetical protein